MSKRKQITAGVAGLVLLLLTWAVFTALIQGAEVEKLRIENESLRCELGETVAELTKLLSWMAEMGLPVEIEEPPAAEDEGAPPTPEEALHTSDFSAAGLTYPSGYGPETRDYWFPQGIEPVMEIYLGWREAYPEGYARLIAWGRGEVPPRQLDPAMIEASRIAAAGQNIDDYMAHWPHSPLGGYGQDFAYAGWKHGINPYLLIALTAAESTFATDGSLVRTHHNAWGMKGPNKTGLYAEGGWMWWPDWSSAIDGAAYFISVYWPGAQTAYNLRGYCEGNPPPWIRNVEVVREAMGGVM